MTVIAQRGETFAGYNTLTTMCCPSCGVLYALPERLIAAARERGNRERVWYCPNGHELGYNDAPGEAEADKLRRQLEDERARAGRQSARADQLESRLIAQKGAATRARNERDRLARRVQAGVCPCCNRTFKQLARHMATQHPDFERAERG